MNSDEWIRADQVDHLLESHGKDQAAGHAQLRAGLEAGRIRASAMDATLERFSGMSHREWTEQDWEVDPEVWKWKSGGTTHLDLPAGKFDAYRGEKYSKVRLTGLSFHRGDLISYVGLYSAGGLVIEGTPKGKGGRKAARGWPVFAAALAEWVLNSGDDEAAFVEKGSDTILGEVLQLAQGRTDEDLPRSTYQPAVQEFVDLMTQAVRRK